MKNLVGVLLASVLVLVGTASFAEEGFYVKGMFKYVMPADPTVADLNVENDNGYGWGGAVGMSYYQFRVEGEIATQKTDLEALGIKGEDSGVTVNSGDIRMTTYMVNGYYDIPIYEEFGFYLTAGLGYGTVTMSVYDIDGDDGGFAWKGGAGMFYVFNDQMMMDLGWEYVSMDDADLDVEVSDLYTNNIVAAFRYAF